MARVIESIGPDRYWEVWGVEQSIVFEGCRDPYCDSDEGNCADHQWIMFDRTEATRLAIALATELAGKPVPPIDEADGQLELPFLDPPWQR
jgi:hypothetical protein